MEKQVLDRMRFLSTLLKIGHGDLGIYTRDALPVAEVDPMLFAHTTVWNHKNSKVRDGKVAFPVISVKTAEPGTVIAENAVACMVDQGPREVYRAVKYAVQLEKSAGRRAIDKAVTMYLRKREENKAWWDRTAVSGRKALKGLYAICHVKPAPWAEKILFKNQYPKGSVFQAIHDLKTMPALEAAGTIIKFKIPMQVAIGSGVNVKDEGILLSIIEGMSANELVNSTAMLKKLGVFERPALRAAYEKAAERGISDKRANVLKAGEAAKHVDQKMAKKLGKIQEDQSRNLKKIDGDWLVLGDRSYSMYESIEVARQIAGFLAHQVSGKVYLVFFDEEPEKYDVTGWTLEEIKAGTAHVHARGATRIGCGMQYVLDKGIMVSGIAIATDGGENRMPVFSDVYRKYAEKFGIEPTVYVFDLPGDVDYFTPRLQSAGISFDKFDLRHGFDYYSLPNLLQTMRASRFDLLDEIMKTPLLTLEDVFK